MNQPKSCLRPLLIWVILTLCAYELVTFGTNTQGRSLIRTLSGEIYYADWTYKTNASLEKIGFMEASRPSKDINTAFGGNNRTFRGKMEGFGGKKIRALLLSSVGRSGSSLLGELLAQIPNTLYFFEPIMYLEKQTSEGVTQNRSVSILRTLFSCQIQAEDKFWTYDEIKRKRIRQDGLTAVCKNKKLTDSWRCAQDACAANANIVAKVIRMRVSWIKKILADPRYAGVKVIHLTRDPRGIFLSQKRRNMSQRFPSLYCPKILQDLELLNSTIESFPRTFTSVKYEDFCRNPKGVAMELWRFVSGNPQAGLPAVWSNYLRKHTILAHTSTEKPFGTTRNTNSQFQKWRREISQSLLRKVEEACGDVIELLGHRRFSSIEEARNLSIPLM